jgi:CheY-like chemotaxis protein
MREILIADDNVALRQALKLALEVAGYRVRVAAHGGEAFALQSEHPADVLVTDIFMPESDGFETIVQFQQSFPDTKIVVISGDAQRIEREYLSAAALMGVDATLKKPFHAGDLLRVLESLDR